MIKINPGVLIAMGGLIGLIIALVDDAGEIGGKIPLALFFLMIIIVGIAIEVAPKEYTEDTYGEYGSGRGFS